MKPQHFFFLGANICYSITFNLNTTKKHIANKYYIIILTIHISANISPSNGDLEAYKMYNVSIIIWIAYLRSGCLLLFKRETKQMIRFDLFTLDSVGEKKSISVSPIFAPKKDFTLRIIAFNVYATGSYLSRLNKSEKSLFIFQFSHQSMFYSVL